MRFRDDRRAVALQVGAILLFGFLIIGLTLYQATVVPNQNEGVEFDHNQQVQESLQDLRNGILRTASAERTNPISVPLGTRYPTRIVAVNPPPSSGRLAAEPGGTVTLVNATAINDETADYWNGSDQSYTTKRLSYRPDYSLYQAAPRTTYANSVLYNQFDGRDLSLSDQQLLEGNRIYVVTLNGSYGRSGTQAVSVSPTPVSASDRTVAINDSDGLELQVDTGLSQSEWRSLLEDQYERNGGRIAGNESGVTVTGGRLAVDLVPGTYRLRMAKVGVGTGVTDTTEQYLTVVDGADSVTPSGTRRIVLEVRDSYNNPVSGVTVDASVNRSDAEILPGEAVSDGQGQVVFEYVAPESLDGARADGINFTYRGSADRADFSGEEPESVRINVTVVSLSGGTEPPAPSETVIYPDGFLDGDGDYPESSEDIIPPYFSAAGDLSSFDNLQADDGQTATIDGNAEVGVVTRDIPQDGSEYTLELEYTGFGNKVDIVIVDGSDDQLQREGLSKKESFEQTSITLNSDARDYVRNNGVLYVRYETGGGRFDFELDYQRLRVT